MRQAFDAFLLVLNRGLPVVDLSLESFIRGQGFSYGQDPNGSHGTPQGGLTFTRLNMLKA